MASGVAVWRAAHKDEARRVDHADVILVLGAAEYNGRPSPTFEGRLRQAANLFRKGFSERVLVLGGKQPGDRTTEAEAGRSWLVSEGLPRGQRLLRAGGQQHAGELGGGRVVHAGPGSRVGVSRVRSLAQPEDPQDGQGPRDRGVRLRDVALRRPERVEAVVRLFARDLCVPVLPCLRQVGPPLRKHSAVSLRPRTVKQAGRGPVLPWGRSEHQELEPA